MEQWLLDKIYSLGKIVAVLDRRVSALEKEEADREDAERTDKLIEPGHRQAKISIAGIVVSVLSALLSALVAIYVAMRR